MTKKKHPARGAAGPAAEESAGRPYTMNDAMSDLWESLDSQDVLTAELEVGSLLALPMVNDGSRQDHEEFTAAVIQRALRSSKPELAAAFFRVLMSLSSGDLKKAASGALRDVTSSGVYPPGWVSQLGKPVPVEAWHRHDVFGETESVIIVFAYDEKQHAVMARIDRSMLPCAVLAAVTTDPDALIQMAKDVSDVESCEQIPLELAHALVDMPLLRAARGDRRLSPASVAFLPVVRSHVKRLPQPAEGTSPHYTAADRAAAVQEFLASPAAAQAGVSPEVARCWAWALTAYSGRAAGLAPWQVGPKTVIAMLQQAVAMFPMTSEALAGAEPAVTAWVTWAAGRQALGEDALAEVLDAMAEPAKHLPGFYDSPDNRLTRCYVGDIARPGTDMDDITEVLTRRGTAIPIPKAGEPADEADLTDPAVRAAKVAAEFARCAASSAGDSAEDVIAGVTRVVEELWTGEPAGTWQEMQDLLVAGTSRHDAIHALAGSRKAG